MTMRIDGDYAVFSTGKRIYANNGIIGLSPDREVTNGYDGGFGGWSDDGILDAEYYELCTHMIRKWRELRKQQQVPILKRLAIWFKECCNA